MIEMRVTDVIVIKLINGWFRLCVIGRLDLIICCEIDGIFIGNTLTLSFLILKF